MKIHLHKLDEDGIELAGEEERDILDLGNGEATRQAGPITYEFQAGLDGDDVWVTGSISVDLELQCGRCLEAFPYPLSIPDVALHLPSEGQDVIDLTPHVREDILLALPAYPRCDWAGDKKCAALAQDSALPEDSATAENRETAPPSPVWGALDALQLKDPH